MVKTLIVLVLLFDGTLVKDKFELPIAMSVHECLDFSEKYRETIATHSWEDPRGQGYYLNNGKGILQGFIC